MNEKGRKASFRPASRHSHPPLPDIHQGQPNQRMIHWSSGFRRPVLPAALLVLVLSLAPGSNRGADPERVSVPSVHLVGIAAAQSGEPPGTFSETHGDWLVECTARETTDGQQSRQCGMEQRLALHDEESGQTRQLLTVTLTWPQPDGAAMSVLTPLGLLLDRGVELEIDTGTGFRLPFRTCLSVGCLAQGQLAGEILDQLGAGKILTARMIESTGKQLLQVQVSLEGFAAASARLQEAVAQ